MRNTNHSLSCPVKTIIMALVVCSIPLRAQFKTQKAVEAEVHLSDGGNVLKNNEQTVLCLPIYDIRIATVNDTKKAVKKEFPDSFFIESTNELIRYECSKRYQVSAEIEGFSGFTDSSFMYAGPRYSVLKNDTARYDSMSQYIRRTAKEFNADLVLVPYSCILKNIVFQEKAWRQESSNTARPIRYKAQTAIHLQIWDKTGALLYEKVGKNQTKRPILYSIFRKRRMKDDESIEEFSRKYFAPPLVRSLSESISRALDFKEKR
jgi:hypothetical protein